MAIVQKTLHRLSTVRRDTAEIVSTYHSAQWSGNDPSLCCTLVA